MTSINSNCSRVDAVKAMANQLKLQVSQAPKTNDARKAENQLQSLDQVIKSGDAQKAEIAVSSVSSAVRALDTQDASPTETQDGLDVYA